MIFKLFLRPNCTKSVAWPPLRAIQNVKSTIQFQSYIHDININIWTSSYMIQMLIKILLSPTSDISKLLYLAHKSCQIVIHFFYQTTLHDINVTDGGTSRKAARRAGSWTTTTLPGVGIFDQFMGALDGISRKKSCSFRHIGGKSLICRSHLRAPITQSANNQQDRPCQLQQQVWDWGWRQLGWEREQGD